MEKLLGKGKRRDTIKIRKRTRTLWLQRQASIHYRSSLLHSGARVILHLAGSTCPCTPSLEEWWLVCYCSAQFSLWEDSSIQMRCWHGLAPGLSCLLVFFSTRHPLFPLYPPATLYQLPWSLPWAGRTPSYSSLPSASYFYGICWRCAICRGTSLFAIYCSLRCCSARYVYSFLWPLRQTFFRILPTRA